MKAVEIQLDYFQIYGLDNPVDVRRRLDSAARTVHLKGQFNPEAVKSRVEWLRYFADRAEKNDEALYDANAHLTIYQLNRPARWIRRRVQMANQFFQGEPQRLEIRDAMALMVPARKRIGGGEWTKETELDHFVMYRVTRGRPANVVVKLEDQFGKRETWVHQPYAFAVPVSKTRKTEHPCRKDWAHLTIYAVDASEDVPTAVDILDQFFPEKEKPLRLKLEPAFFLAVPSKKYGWEEI